MNDNTDGPRPDGIIRRLPRWALLAAGGSALFALILLFRSGDQAPSTTVSLPAESSTSTVAEIAGPQVSPIDACGLLEFDEVVAALGLGDTSSFLALERGEGCLWESEEAGTSLMVSPSTQDRFAEETVVEGFGHTNGPRVGDLSVWFSNSESSLVATATDTALGVLFVELRLNRPDLGEADRQALASDLVAEVIDRIRLGPPKPVTADLCGLIPDQQAESLLGLHRKGRPGTRDEVFVTNDFSDPVDLEGGDDASCQKLISTEIYIKAATGEASDFDPAPEIDGVRGQHVEGVGDDAVIFENVPGGGSFAAPHDTSLIAVKTGNALFRIVIALPDLSPEAQRRTLFHLAAIALAQINGGGEEVITLEPAPYDTSELSYVDHLLSTAIDDEELADGLVSILSVFAGEKEPNDETPMNLLDSSGTEVVRMARSYATAHPNEDISAEITRLLGLLVPPTFPGSSIPQDEVHVGGLTAAAGRSLLVVTELEEEEELQDGGQSGGYAPPPDLPDQDRTYAPPPDWPEDDASLPPSQDDQAGCEFVDAPGFQVITAISDPDIEPTRALVFVPETASTIGWSATHLVYTIEAIQDSIAVFGSSSVPCLHVALSSSGTPDSYVLDATELGMCGIILNQPMIGLEEARFKQHVARDIAHCSIPVSFPEQFAIASFDNRRWWNHAYAEFMSNLVYPGPICSGGRCDLEWRWAGAFTGQELGVPMMDRRDDNWIFFQYLWWQSGAEGVRALVKALPASSEPAAHERAVAGIAGMSERFHSFTEAVTDSSVEDSGGGTVPLVPQAIPVEVSSEMLILEEAYPFQTFRLHMTVPAGQIACIENGSSDSVLVSFRNGSPGEGGAWERMPADETVYRGDFTVVATSTGEGQFDLDVTKVTDESDCEKEDEPAEPDNIDPPCLDVCGPSDFYKFSEQLAEWFRSLLAAAG